MTKVPWDDSELSSETSLIASDLAKVNKRGVLTINSQPNINAAPSSDPKLGWGSPNGYIFQKVCYELRFPGTFCKVSCCNL